MLENNDTSSSLPYKNRNFIVDDSDKDLFVRMKSIVDAGFPPSSEPILLELYKMLWEKRKKLAYKEIGESTIYIHFPKINPLIRLFGTIALWFTSKEKDDS